jgi:hypothetical protein
MFFFQRRRAPAVSSKAGDAAVKHIMRAHVQVPVAHKPDAGRGARRCAAGPLPLRPVPGGVEQLWRPAKSCGCQQQKQGWHSGAGAGAGVSALSMRGGVHPSSPVFRV